MSGPPARRQNIRVGAKCPVTITTDDGASITLHTRDVSARGALLSDAPAELDSADGLNVCFFSDGTPLTVPATVMERRGVDLAIAWQPLGLAELAVLRAAIEEDRDRPPFTTAIERRLR